MRVVYISFCLFVLVAHTCRGEDQAVASRYDIDIYLAATDRDDDATRAEQCLLADPDRYKDYLLDALYKRNSAIQQCRALAILTRCKKKDDSLLSAALFVVEQGVAANPHAFSDELRVAAGIRAVSIWGSSREVPLLLKFLSDDSFIVRQKAAEGLGVIGRERDCPLIEEAAIRIAASLTKEQAEKDESIKAAFMAIGQIKHRSFLRQLKQSPSPR